jgi:hypothetical protein
MTKAVVTDKGPLLFFILMGMLVLDYLFFAGVTVCHAKDAVCAEVKIEIKQELTLERQAFDAHMRINNGLTHISLEDVGVTVKFTDADGNTVLATSDPDDTSARFFIRIDTLTNINHVSGNGNVAPSTSADIHWLIIPAPGASNGLESGALYYVGASLTYTIGGKTHETIVSPDYIYVKPMPKITLDYFLPSEVYGDDAFTQTIEPPIPFSLGVRVKNSGHGIARKLSIESAQPKIVENEQGLLIGFAILGSRVNGKVATDSLLVDFGDIVPNRSGTARWIMTCSLSGRFVEFNADFSHSNELGGTVTSFIKAVETHFLVRDVFVDAVGRDHILDFLAKDGDVYRVYESESMEKEVVDQTPYSSLTYLTTENNRPSYRLGTSINNGFLYVRLPDPHNGGKVIHAAVREDGKIIKPENIWLSKSRDGQNWDYFLNLFDVAGTGEYTIVFSDPTAAPKAPVLQYIDNVIAVEGNRISFIVQASDPDGTVPSLSAAPLPVGAGFNDQGDGSAIFHWTPSIGQAGSYGITFTAQDGVLTDKQRVNFSIRSIIDVDGDGMNDAWEMEHFGTLERNGAGDYDNDGISDLEEFLNGSDPTFENHAPTVPIILSPSLDEWMETRTPELTIKNSSDADNDQISYEFEVYADSGLTRLTASDLVKANAAATTTWMLPVELDENKRYFFRVRAFDGLSYSLWAYGDFTVDAINEPPQDPMISYPPNGGTVDTVTPFLEITGATDPDEEVLTYAFKIYTDAALTTLATDIDGLVVPENGVAGWMVDTALTHGKVYFWRALVTDGKGHVSKTSPAVFTVNTLNHAPTMPIITYPIADAEVAATDIVLRIQNAVDADGDAVLYRFEIDTKPDFTSANKITSDLVTEEPGTTGRPVSDLKDNTFYYWRVMATDTQACSPWVTGRFFVNTANDRPTAPTLKNPGEAAWVDVLTPELYITKALDLDGGALTYRYEVYTEPTLENLAARGETDATHWRLTTELNDKTRYYWRARATDEHGAIGSWTSVASFFVKKEEQTLPDTIEVTVSTDKGRPIQNIKVYAFTAAGAFTGLNSTTDFEGKASFNTDTLAPGDYMFRADYLKSSFWSDVFAFPQIDNILLKIDSKIVAVTIAAGSGPVSGARVYLFSATGSYLDRYLVTDANGEVFFDLPVGETFMFRVDILGNRYWSEAVTVSNGGADIIAVDAGGGRLQATVQMDDTTPIAGTRVYLFSGSGKYLGVYQTTNEDGIVGFNVTEAEYLLRVDYLGHKFWSEVIDVATDTTETIRVAHQPVRLMVQGCFRENNRPIRGIKIDLFSAAGSYLDRTLTTDENGQVEFNLPAKEYQFRARYLGNKYWSEPVTWDDPTITIPIAKAKVIVNGAGHPKKRVKVFVFSKSGRYLKIKRRTNKTGRVFFRLPEGEYDFRADYGDRKFWAKNRTLAADVVNDVNISVGGGTFQLNVKTDSGQPLAGLKCRLFNKNKRYLKLSAFTNEAGVATFNLRNGTYRFRVDYLGRHFWSDKVIVYGNRRHAMVIAQSKVAVEVIFAQAPAVRKKVYLFSPFSRYRGSRYLGKYKVTDDNGRVSFNLPVGIPFRFRADILGHKYWSRKVVVPYDGALVIVDAGGGRMRMTVTSDNGTPFNDLKAHLFNKSGEYLGFSGRTDTDGRVEFRVPEGVYRVRVDDQGTSFWKKDIRVFSDMTTRLVIPLSSISLGVEGGDRKTDRYRHDQRRPESQLKGNFRVSSYNNFKEIDHEFFEIYVKGDVWPDRKPNSRHIHAHAVKSNDLNPRYLGVRRIDPERAYSEICARYG